MAPMDASFSPETVVPVDVPWRPAEGSAAPVLFYDGELAVLIFSAARSAAATGVLKGFRRSVSPAVAVKVPGEPARVELRFDGCLATRFGYPDTVEVVRRAGGDGLFEVVNSAWRASILAAAGGPVDPTWPDPIQHFVVVLDRTIFECLCGSVRGRATDLTVGEILAALSH
jgi:hypothetical protein